MKMRRVGKWYLFWFNVKGGEMFRIERRLFIPYFVTPWFTIAKNIITD